MKKKPSTPPVATTLPETWPLTHCEKRIAEIESLYRYELAQGRSIPKADAVELRQLRARKYLLVHGNRQKP